MKTEFVKKENIKGLKLSGTKYLAFFEFGRWRLYKDNGEEKYENCKEIEVIEDDEALVFKGIKEDDYEKVNEFMLSVYNTYI